MRYCLVRDESAHWYIIPVDRSDDFEKLMYPEGDFDWDAWDDALDDWIVEVGGSPSNVQFENYKIV